MIMMKLYMKTKEYFEIEECSTQKPQQRTNRKNRLLREIIDKKIFNSDN